MLENNIIQCKYCKNAMTSPRNCCAAGIDVDQLRTQLEVARSGYSTAVQTATQQARSAHEFADLKKAVEQLTKENKALYTMAHSNRPQFEIDLPEGDNRKVHIWWSLLNVTDGKWHLCVDIGKDDIEDTERLNWIESNPIELIAELLQLKYNKFEIRKIIDKIKGID